MDSIVNKNRKPLITEYVSLYLIPLYIVMFTFYKPIRPYFFISSIVVVLIGNLDTLLRYYYFKNLNLSSTINSILGHSLILIFVFSSIYEPPIYSHLLLVLAITTIILLPKWPYVINKTYFILLYCLIYVLVYYMTYKYLKN